MKGIAAQTTNGPGSRQPNAAHLPVGLPGHATVIRALELGASHGSRFRQSETGAVLAFHAGTFLLAGLTGVAPRGRQPDLVPMRRVARGWGFLLGKGKIQD